MNINGTISAVNQRRQRYAIKTSHGYTIADLIDGELNINDEVSGTLDDHGETMLRNFTSGDMVEVRIDAYYASAESAAKLLAQ